MYTIVETPSEKILIVPAKERFKWRFFHTATDRQSNKQVDMMDLGESYMLPITHEVLVYKIPSVNDYHFEVLRQNSRRYFIGCKEAYPVDLDYDGILENMVEFVEKIHPVEPSS